MTILAQKIPPVDKMTIICRSLFSLLLLLIVVSSCKSEFDKFNDQIVEFASNDSRIGQEEYETLIEKIKNSNERGFLALKKANGELDHNKISAYLVKYSSIKGVSIQLSDVWQPGQDLNTKVIDFDINFFLENSASMDGYVNTNSTDFKAAILDLLTDLKSFSRDTLNLHYINSKVITIEAVASNDDIRNFYQNLNKANFREQGGTRGSSDIGEMLSQVLDSLETGNLSVLVSDFVFSPGGKNAANYLEGQRSQIRNKIIETKSRMPDLSVAILKGKAKFEGTYHDKNDDPIPIKDMERPYYVWLIGSSAQIKSIMDAKVLEQARGSSYTNKLVLQPVDEAIVPKFKIQYAPKIGDFDAQSLSQGVIAGAEASTADRTRGVFEFSVAVDFSTSSQDPSYFLDSTNYKPNDKSYSIRIKPITDNSNVALTGFTHLLTLRTTDLKEEPLLIEVKGNIPSWVYTSTSDDDTGIKTDESQANKTFGFRYLVEGVANAFYPESQSNALYKIPITIKK